MTHSFEAYRQAARRAVAFQIAYQQPDGGYIWQGYARDAYHKQAYSWSLAGELEPAHRLLTWVRTQRLEPTGQLREYGGDVYKHSWMFQGAHRLGRFDVSYPILSFLRSCEAPCGGFPHFAGDPYCRSMATACTGLSAVYAGDLAMARRAADWAIRLLDQQPDESHFYFRTTLDGKLVTPDMDPQAALGIDITKPKQDYWEVGLPLQLMCRMYQATGEASFLEHARRLFEFKLRCFTDAFGWAGSGKSALGSALYYLLTGDPRARQAACSFCDFLVASQYPEGGWRDETEPDQLLIYVDHAAEFSVWLQEIAALLPAADTLWSGGTR